MTDRQRVVFDTNIYLSAVLSRNERSPSRELLARLEQNQFDLLICQQLLDELIEKLLERDLDPQSMIDFVANVVSLSDLIAVPPETIEPVITDDPDDDVILACAILGRANVIVTYDRHFDALDGAYHSIPIMTGLAFLQRLRESLAPDEES